MMQRGIHVGKNNSAHSTAKSNIVHESEIQRQHIRVSVPAKVSINGQQFDLVDLSAGGFRISAPQHAEELKIQGQQQVVINFSDDEYDLKIDANPQHIDNGIIGYRFSNLNSEQISILHHIISLYMAGQTINAEELAKISLRDNFGNDRKQKSTTPNSLLRTQMIRTFLPLALIFLAGLISLILLTGNIFERYTVVKSYSANVEGNVFTLRAYENGTFRSLITLDTEMVTKNQPIGMFNQKSTFDSNLDTASNEESSEGTENQIIRSPCDCIVHQHSARTGEFKAIGESLFKLLPVNDEAWVTAILSPTQVQKLKLLDDAKIRIVGQSKFIEGNVVQFIP